MKLTESQLRNLIKQELKQFFKLNEGDDTSSNLDSLDTEISDEDSDEELSDEDGNFYVIDKKKAFDYLKQFNSEEVDAKQFIKDDEGWGEFEQYLEDVEQMSDKELEDSMRQDLSFYYFSKPDELN